MALKERLLMVSIKEKKTFLDKWDDKRLVKKFKAMWNSKVKEYGEKKFNSNTVSHSLLQNG